MKRLNINIGDRFHRLIVIQELEPLPICKNRRRIQCQCDCGKIIITSPNSLVSGNTKSCGCYFRDIQRSLKTTHGKSLSRDGLYTRWRNMKKRCYNTKSPCYKWYGAKGIEVCEEWRKNFASFESWAVANGFNNRLHLDRIDRSKHYEPSNCRWVSQSCNSRKANIDSGRATYVTYRGITHNILEWSKILNIKASTLHSRLIYLRWDLDKAFNTPIRPKARKGNSNANIY